MSCEICPILANPSEEEVKLRLAEGAFWRFTLRGNDQSLLGTTFATAKRHVSSLGELHVSEWQEFAVMNSNLEIAIKQAFGAQVINTSCLMNLAFKPDTSSTPKPHVHWHIKPRYASPVEVPGIDQSFIDPNFGQYLRGDHPRRPLDIEESLIVANIIKGHMPAGY